MTPIRVRWMIRRDMADVLRIEAASFRQPWAEEDFLKMLRQRQVIGMVGVVPRHVEAEDRVVGFVLYELYGRFIDILNLAVDPGRRRRQVGRQIVEYLLGTKLKYHHRRRMTVNVRDDNLGAHLFFKSLGFQATGVLPGYYEDSDAYSFEYRLPVEELV